MSAMNATRPNSVADASGGRNVKAATSNRAATPALNLKNFTPASRETKTSVKTMPIARCERKRKRTIRQVRQGGQEGLEGEDAEASVSSPSCLSCPSCPSSLAQSLIDLRPVDYVPPRVDVVGPAVLVLEVVRVLPHIDAKHGLLSVHQRVVLVRCALDRELAPLIDHPR